MSQIPTGSPALQDEETLPAGTQELEEVRDIRERSSHVSDLDRVPETIVDALEENLGWRSHFGSSQVVFLLLFALFLRKTLCHATPRMAAVRCPFGIGPCVQGGRGHHRRSGQFLTVQVQWGRGLSGQSKPIPPQTFVAVVPMQLMIAVLSVPSLAGVRRRTLPMKPLHGGCVA